MIDALNLYELEKLAKEKLPQSAHGYYASGAWDEVTLRENHTAFERIKTHYRVLVDVSRRDMSTTLFGHRISMPILIAPTAFHNRASGRRTGNCPCSRQSGNVYGVEQSFDESRRGCGSRRDRTGLVSTLCQQGSRIHARPCGASCRGRLPGIDAHRGHS